MDTLRFNKKHINVRDIDTLIGISKALVLDGKVDQQEATFLHSWLVSIAREHSHPIIKNLLNKVQDFLEDGVLDDDESLELFKILHSVSGGTNELGELAKTTSLPLTKPVPKITTFANKSFLFTGLCIYGNRKECQELVLNMQGIVAKGINKTLDYLILGSYVNEQWKHQTFGTKIAKAIEYQEKGLPLKIISEEHFLLQAEQTFPNLFDK